MKYVHRILAALLMLMWAGWSTSLIGKPPTCEGVDWNDAWTFVGAQLVTMLLGWQAGRESKETPHEH